MPPEYHTIIREQLLESLVIVLDFGQQAFRKERVKAGIIPWRAVIVRFLCEKEKLRSRVFCNKKGILEKIIMNLRRRLLCRMNTLHLPLESRKILP